MKYSEAFIAKCLTIHTEGNSLRINLNRGSQIVGRILCDSKGLRMSHKDMLDLLLAGEVDKVIKVLKDAEERAELYKEWVRDYT